MLPIWNSGDHPWPHSQSWGHTVNMEYYKCPFCLIYGQWCSSKDYFFFFSVRCIVWCWLTVKMWWEELSLCRTSYKPSFSPQQVLTHFLPSAAPAVWFISSFSPLADSARCFFCLFLYDSLLHTLVFNQRDLLSFFLFPRPVVYFSFFVFIIFDIVIHNGGRLSPITSYLELSLTWNLLCQNS